MTVTIVKKKIKFSAAERDVIAANILIGANIEDQYIAEQSLLIAERLQGVLARKGFSDSYATRRAVLEKIFDLAETDGYIKPRPTYRSVLNRRK